MRRLIQAILLTLALTAPSYAGDMGQPIVAPSNAAAYGDMQCGITETALTILDAVLSLI
jgi:hypothetical protein